MSQARTWLFTINNPESNDIPIAWTDVKHAIWQLEKGENDVPHLQGYVSFTKRHRISSLKKINSRAHWEARKGTVEQAIAYCSKEDTRVAGPWEVGKREQGKRNDLAGLQDDLDDNKSMKFVSKEHFHPYLKYHRGIQNYRRIQQAVRTEKSFVGVIIGETGVGKSKLMADRFPGAFWKSCNDKWWDDYDFQDVVIIDEYYGWLPYHYLLRLLDRYPLNVESKGGMLNFNPKQIWICSNAEPENWYKFNERMKYSPLERRIDFYAIMSAGGTLDIKKGNNPFDVFPENIPTPEPEPFSLFADEILPLQLTPNLPRPIPLRETTFIPDIGDSNDEEMNEYYDEVMYNADTTSDTDEPDSFESEGAAAYRDQLKRKDAAYYFAFSSDDEF